MKRRLEHGETKFAVHPLAGNSSVIGACPMLNNQNGSLGVMFIMGIEGFFIQYTNYVTYHGRLPLKMPRENTQMPAVALVVIKLALKRRLGRLVSEWDRRPNVKHTGIESMGWTCSLTGRTCCNWQIQHAPFHCGCCDLTMHRYRTDRLTWCKKYCVCNLTGMLYPGQ